MFLLLKSALPTWTVLHRNITKEDITPECSKLANNRKKIYSKSPKKEKSKIILSPVKEQVHVCTPLFDLQPVTFYKIPVRQNSATTGYVCHFCITIINSIQGRKYPFWFSMQSFYTPNGQVFWKYLPWPFIPAVISTQAITFIIYINAVRIYPGLDQNCFTLTLTCDLILLNTANIVT